MGGVGPIRCLGRLPVRRGLGGCGTVPRVSDPAVLFVDMAGYTALTEAHGDHDAADLAERFYAMVSGVLVPPARLVKTIGDAVLVVAPDAAHGLMTALAIADAADRVPNFPEVRAGLHVGPLVERQGDVFGATVNLAARVASHARGDQILVTASTLAALPGGLAARAVPQGAVRFKNVAGAVEVFLVERDRAPTSAGALDPVCRMRVDPACCIVRVGPDGQPSYFCSEQCAETFACSSHGGCEGA